MSPARDLSEVVADDSALGLTLATDLHVAKMPDTPNACVALYDAGGQPAERASGVNQIEYPQIQVRVRGGVGDSQGAWSVAKDVHDLLDGYQGTINGTVYMDVKALHLPAFIAFDEKNRPLYSVNFQITRTVAG